MRFLVDNQLPPSLARWLRDRGLDAEHVFESGLHLLDDLAFWARALADAVKPEAGAEGMRDAFRWSGAYSLSLRLGLPGSRARRSETAATEDGHDPGVDPGARPG